MIESSAASTHYSQLSQIAPIFSSRSANFASTAPINSSGNSSADEVTISPEAKSIVTRRKEEASTKHGSTAAESAEKSTQVTAEEQREITKLQRRDAEVRAHEQAHLSAAGQHAAGGMSFTYEVGPNGKRYATGGEVPIDLSREKTPEETIAKMQQVAKAALAPANPSAADRNIAARAHSIAAEARNELNETVSTAETKKMFEHSNIRNRQTETYNEMQPKSSDLPEGSGSSSFMPSRQMVLRAYAQNS